MKKRKSIFSDAPPSDVCGGCGLTGKGVEAGGIWACANPLCSATGASWFRATLKSYKDQGSDHSVDPIEWTIMGLKHAIDSKDNRILEAAVNSAAKRINYILDIRTPNPEEEKKQQFHKELDSLLKKYGKGA